MGDLGLPDQRRGGHRSGWPAPVWGVREAGLNIMMSMKGDGKLVSFIEDCAVPWSDLAEYTERLNKVFRKHGTVGTWYAHPRSAPCMCGRCST